MDAFHLFGHGLARGASRLAGRIVTLVAVAAACLVGSAVLGAAPAGADVGDLGAPPTDFEAKQALTALYNWGKPPDATIDVAFAGPVIVGTTPTMHPNPQPDPWCVRCGYPDQGSSLMYPVMALVEVTTTQGFEASALPETSYRHVNTVTYNGTPCTGEHKAEYCPAYFFYRDNEGLWRVATG